MDVTEQQRYRVLEERAGVERRRYDACVVADVTVDGSQESAGTAAFRPLVSYISGANVRGDRLAMTAPVIQESAGEQLAMTAPVLQEAAGEGAWTVSFVLPGEGDLPRYPEPTDARVRLRAVPAHDAAAVRWSGRWSAENVAKHTRRLLDEVDAAGWMVAGPVRWARFDPPWKPPFARRNEVVVPVLPSE